MALDGEQGIRSLDSAMLPGVAGKNHPGIVLASKTQQFQHLPSANLPRLVHNHDRTGDSSRLRRKFATVDGDGSPLSPCPRLADVAARGRRRAGQPAELVRPVHGEQNSCLCPRRHETRKPHSLRTRKRREPYAAHRPMSDLPDADWPPTDGKPQRLLWPSGRSPIHGAIRRAG